MSASRFNSPDKQSQLKNQPQTNNQQRVLCSAGNSAKELKIYSLHEQFIPAKIGDEIKKVSLQIVDIILKHIHDNPYTIGEIKTLSQPLHKNFTVKEWDEIGLLLQAHGYNFMKIFAHNSFVKIKEIPQTEVIYYQTLLQRLLSDQTVEQKEEQHQQFLKTIEEFSRTYDPLGSSSKNPSVVGVSFSNSPRKNFKQNSLGKASNFKFSKLKSKSNTLQIQDEEMPNIKSPTGSNTNLLNTFNQNTNNLAANVGIHMTDDLKRLEEMVTSIQLSDIASMYGNQRLSKNKRKRVRQSDENFVLSPPGLLRDQNTFARDELYERDDESDSISENSNMISDEKSYKIVKGKKVKLSAEELEERRQQMKIQSDLKHKIKNTSIEEKVLHWTRDEIIKYCQELYDGNQEHEKKQVKSQELINKMRRGYLYEILQLKEQYGMNVNQDKPEYLEIHYFDPTEGLDKDMCNLMNHKIKLIKEQFETSLIKFQQTNDELQRQITIFKAIGEDGNIGIKFEEMNAESVIRKLSYIEKNPNVIWEEFDKSYSHEFFFPVLEQQFGISPDTHAQLVDKFDNELNMFKMRSKEKFESFQKKFEEELNRLRNYEKNKLTDQMRYDQMKQLEIEEAKKQTIEIMEIKLQAQMTQQFRKYDEEKAEMLREIKNLEADVANTYEIKRKANLKIFFQNWFVYAKLQGIEMANDEFQKALKANQVKNQMVQRELSLSNLKTIVKQLREDLNYARQEIKEFIEKISDLNYQIYELKKTNDIVSEKLEKQQNENHSLVANNEAIIKQSAIYKDEYLEYKNGFNESQKYVEILQGQLKQYTKKIERLNTIAIKYNCQPEEIESSVAKFQVGSKEAINTLNKIYTDQLENIQYDKEYEKACQTILQDITKPIDREKQSYEIPTREQEIQTEDLGIDEYTQTGLEGQVKAKNEFGRRQTVVAGKLSNVFRQVTQKVSNEKRKNLTVKLKSGDSNIIQEKQSFDKRSNQKMSKMEQKNATATVNQQIKSNIGQQQINDDLSSMIEGDNSSMLLPDVKEQQTLGANRYMKSVNSSLTENEYSDDHDQDLHEQDDNDKQNDFDRDENATQHQATQPGLQLDTNQSPTDNIQEDKTLLPKTKTIKRKSKRISSAHGYKRNKTAVTENNFINHFHNHNVHYTNEYKIVPFALANMERLLNKNLGLVKKETGTQTDQMRDVFGVPVRGASGDGHEGTAMASFEQIDAHTRNLISPALLKKHSSLTREVTTTNPKYSALNKHRDSLPVKNSKNQSLIDKIFSSDNSPPHLTKSRQNNNTVQRESQFSGIQSKFSHTKSPVRQNNSSEKRLRENHSGSKILKGFTNRGGNCTTMESQNKKSIVLKIQGSNQNLQIYNQGSNVQSQYASGQGQHSGTLKSDCNNTKNQDIQTMNIVRNSMSNFNESSINIQMKREIIKSHIGNEDSQIMDVREIFSGGDDKIGHKKKNSVRPGSTTNQKKKVSIRNNLAGQQNSKTALSTKYSTIQQQSHTLNVSSPRNSSQNKHRTLRKLNGQALECQNPPANSSYYQNPTYLSNHIHHGEVFTNHTKAHPTRPRSSYISSNKHQVPYSQLNNQISARQDPSKKFRNLKIQGNNTQAHNQIMQSSGTVGVQMFSTKKHQELLQKHQGSLPHSGGSFFSNSNQRMQSQHNLQHNMSSTQNDTSMHQVLSNDTIVLQQRQYLGDGVSLNSQPMFQNKPKILQNELKKQSNAAKSKKGSSKNNRKKSISIHNLSGVDELNITADLRASEHNQQFELRDCDQNIQSLELQNQARVQRITGNHSFAAGATNQNAHCENDQEVVIHIDKETILKQQRQQANHTAVGANQADLLNGSEPNTPLNEIFRTNKQTANYNTSTQAHNSPTKGL